MSILSTTIATLCFFETILVSFGTGNVGGPWTCAFVSVGAGFGVEGLIGEAVGRMVEVCLDVDLDPGDGVNLLCLLDMFICIEAGVSNKLLQFMLHLVSGRQHQ